MDNERLARRLAVIKIAFYAPQYRDQVMDIAREMHATSIYAEMPFDADKVHRQLSACHTIVPERYFKIAVRDGIVLGGLLGSIGRTFFCDELLAKDSAWMVTASKRGQGAALKLLSDFEEWARSMGARKVMIGQSTERNMEQMTKLYFHLGYRLIGFNTVKDL